MFDIEKSKELNAKLVILYTLAEAECGLGMGEIEDIILPTEIMELLQIPKTLNNLIESSLVDEVSESGRAFFKINKMGSEALNALTPKINEFHKAKLDMAVNVYKRKIKKAQFLNAEYKKVAENESVVNCELNEGGSPLLKFELRVPTNSQAEEICKAWKSRGVDIFQDFLKLFEK